MENPKFFYVNRDFLKMSIDISDFNKDFVFNLLNIYNYRKKGIFYKYFNFIKNNHHKIKGDIYEMGVYDANLLLSLSIFLKKIGSKKIIYGFDTFAGFPKFSKEDEIGNFDKLFKNKQISNNHYNSIKLNLRILKFLRNKKKFNPNNISTAKNFNIDILEIRKKIKFLGLDNIKLIKGDFTKSFPNFLNKHKSKRIFAINMDCDLFKSYKILPLIYKKMNKGAFCHLDEYYSLKFPGPLIACNEFLENFDNVKLKKFKLSSGDFDRYYFTK